MPRSRSWGVAACCTALVGASLLAVLPSSADGSSGLIQLLSASIVSTTLTNEGTATNVAGTVVRYVFSRNVSADTFGVADFKVYPSDDGVNAGGGYAGQGVCTGATCPASTSPDAVDVLFNQAALQSNTGVDSASTLTLAAVASGAVTAGPTANAAGSAAIGTSTTTALTANSTQAPDVTTVGTPRNAQAAGSSAIDLTFDKAAAPAAMPNYLLVFATGFTGTGTLVAGTDNQEEVCTGPTGASPTGSGLTVPGFNTATDQVTIVCPNASGTATNTPITASQIGWIVVGATSVQSTAAAPVANGFMEAASSPAQLGAAPVPRLSGLTLTPGSGSTLDQALFTFDQPLTVPSLDTGFAASDFDFVDASGTTFTPSPDGTCATSAPSSVPANSAACVVSSLSTTTQVLLLMPVGTLGVNGVVGGYVLHGAAANSNNQTVFNADDELGAADAASISQLSGKVNAVQLVSVAAAVPPNGLGGSAPEITYTFTTSVSPGTVGRLHGYDPDGTELTCAAGESVVGASGAPTTAICDGFVLGSTASGTAATPLQLSQLVLGTVDNGAVVGNPATAPAAPDTLPNPEGAAVVPAPTMTTTTLSSSPNPSVIGQLVTFTASVSPDNAAGEVTFFDGSTAIGTAPINSGVATFGTSSLSSGGHSITATFPGGVGLSASTSAALIQHVDTGSTSSTTTLTSNANPAPVGQSVKFTATVSPSAATGQVTFTDLDGQQTLGTVQLTAGVATLTATLAPGVHAIVASYTGDATYTASMSSTLTQTVDGASIAGQVVVAGTATGVSGWVQACDTSPVVCGSVMTDASGNFTISGLPAGSYTVLAFPGDQDVSASVMLTLTAGQSATGVDVSVVAPTPAPAGVSIASPTFGAETSGEPTISWGDSTPFSATECANGTGATLTITTPDDGGAATPVALTETPTGSGTFSGTINGPAILEGAHGGPATFTVALTCPGTGATNESFDGYVDPSGTVVDQNAHPVSNATVTLLRRDDATGVFSAVPNGSSIMSAANRVNPITTGANGAFGWDVVAGTYELQASGCPGSGAQSGPLTIPPAVTNATLTLTCAGSGGGGGVGIVTPTTTSTTVPGSQPITGNRFAGPDRIATAIAISQALFAAAGGTPSGSMKSASAVVLANGFTFPDALVGSPLALAKGGPVLLTHGTSLDASVLAEIQRILPSGKTVYLIGGTDVLSDAVASAISSAGFTVVRYGGADRFATAVLVADQGLGNPTTVLLANGDNYPDALSAGAAAGAKQAALLLTDGTSQAAETSQYLAGHASDTLVSVGGPAASADPSATPLVGSDRYATSTLVAQHFFTNPTIAGLADGLAFPDALTGGAAIATLGGPLLLTNPDELSAATSQYIGAVLSTLKTIDVFGGTLAVSSATMTAATEPGQG